MTRRQAGQALVSDQAAERLAPAGFDPSRGMKAQAAIDFLSDASRYFRNRDTGGEDRAHWANVYNAENCLRAAELIRFYHRALGQIVSWHADARDVFPDWRTTADALASIAEHALRGEDWLRDSDGSGEAGETGTGSTEGDSAAPEGIARD